MQFDLEPHEYTAEPRPGEPVFGSGWPFGVAALAGILITAALHGGPWAWAGAILAAVVTAVSHQFYR